MGSPIWVIIIAQRIKVPAQQNPGERKPAGPMNSIGKAGLRTARSTLERYNAVSTSLEGIDRSSSETEFPSRSRPHPRAPLEHLLEAPALEGLATCPSVRSV
jgi:hypothetical protein